MRCLTNPLTAAALLVAALHTAAGAQDYRFAVPSLQMLVRVQADASVRVVYDITFQNNPTGHAIDVVDIGVPHPGYRLESVRATVGGQPMTDIRSSTVVSPGFEVHLSSRTIKPGRSGTLHVEFDVPEMVYQDTTNSQNASLRITPTWFGEQYVTGNTHIQVAIQLPTSVQPDEVLHQGFNFTQKAVTKDGARVGWDWPAARLTGPYMVAVSFPKRDLDRVVVKTKLDMLLEWFTYSEVARPIAGVVFLCLFAWLFFRFSGATGASVFFLLCVAAGIVFYISPGLHLLSLPVVVVLIGLNEWSLGRRKSRYMPPIAQVEGGGIKRGLTAPEAAALLEMPVAQVLSLVIFGMLKKGILRQTQVDPLAVEVDEAFRTDAEDLADAKQRAKFYRQAGQKRAVVVHKYEHPFLFLLQSNSGKPLEKINFSVPIKALLTRTAARMKGFDLSDTKDYYRSIVRRASEQASAIGDIPQREKALDRNFEWILMDRDYPTVFTYGRPYRPIWMRGSTPGAPAASSAPGVPDMSGQTSFGDVAASFSGWAENTMGNMASAISPGSLQVAGASGGFLDLSGADRVTGEFFQALGEAGASGGGGGCACAGCACACACAGGGR